MQEAVGDDDAVGASARRFAKEAEVSSTLQQCMCVSKMPTTTMPPALSLEQKDNADRQ